MSPTSTNTPLTHTTSRRLNHQFVMQTGDDGDYGPIDLLFGYSAIRLFVPLVVVVIVAVEGGGGGGFAVAVDVIVDMGH